MALVCLGYKSDFKLGGLNANDAPFILLTQHTQRVGIMGNIIARALVQAGHEVVGHDPLPAARDRKSVV